MKNSLSGLEKKTLFSDSLRQGVDGTLDTLRNSVFLLVALKLFHAADWESSLISQAPFIGMLLSLFFTPFLENRFKRTGLVLMLLSIPGAFFLALSAWSDNSLIYALGITFSGIFLFLRVPFFTGLYSENYQSHRRARLLSLGTLLFLLASTATNFIFGEMLDHSLTWFRWIFSGCALLILANGFSLLKVPGELRPRKEKEPFWRSLSLIWKDKKFGLIVCAWFLLGFANLWSLPLRTVYLADPNRGLGLAPSQVLLILGVIPGIVRILFNFIWAHIYDRLSFLGMRLLINLFMSLGILIFFQTEQIQWITLGSVLFNIALAGSPFIWNLWVTRLAPANEVRKYMSVHTFMAGLRGIIGPVAGFAFISSHSIARVGQISFALALIASLMLLPLLSKKHRF